MNDNENYNVGYLNRKITLGYSNIDNQIIEEDFAHEKHIFI